MTRNSYRAIKKSRKRRRKLLRALLPGSAIAIFFAIAAIALNESAIFSSDPTPTPEIFPGARSITIVIDDVASVGAGIYLEPRIDPSVYLYDLGKGDEMTFLGRHPKKGWYLIDGRDRPLWTLISNKMPNLQATLSSLPIVTEVDAAKMFATPAPPP